MLKTKHQSLYYRWHRVK